METNLIGTYDTATMLPALNATPMPRTAIADRLFGGRFTAFPTKYVLFDIQKGKRAMAPFVSRYMGGKLVEKLAMSTPRYEPPMVGSKTIFHGDEAFERMPGEIIGGDMSPEDRMSAAVAGQLGLLDGMTARRIEWMCAQMLATGSIVIAGEGVSDTIDLGFTNTDTLSGTSCWGGTESDIVGNIREWKRAIVKASGITPDTMYLGENAATAFLADSNVQALLDVRNIGVGAINLQDLPNGTEYLGRIAGVDVFGYDEWYIDDTTAVETPMIPVNSAILCPSAARNPGAEMLFGAFYDVADKVTYQGPRIPRAWADKEKNAEFLELLSFPVPKMPDADSWLVATVVE